MIKADEEMGDIMLKDNEREATSEAKQQPENALQAYNETLYRDACSLAIKKRLERSGKGYVSYEDYFHNKLLSRLQKALEAAGINATELRFSSPGKTVDADVSIITSILASANPGHNPRDLAEQTARSLLQLSAVEIAEVTTTGIYVNIKFNHSRFIPAIISEVEKLGERYGESDTLKLDNIVLDYSSPNIAKEMQVGHLRSTIIGESTSRILESSGATVYNINHLGDWGTTFGKLMVVYEKEKSPALDQELDEKPIETLARLYVAFGKLVQEDPSLDEAARKKFMALENGDADIMKLWLKFREWSLIEFNEMYKRMHINFDMYLGESFYESLMAQTVADALVAGLAYKDEDGSVIVPFREEIKTDGKKKINELSIDREVVTNRDLRSVVTPQNNYRVLILRKSDGTSLYATRDLACVKFRKEVFNANRILYFVGHEQSLHFQQVFLLAKALGYINGKEPEHIAFGLLLEKGKKMSTRQGNVFKLRHLMDSARDGAAKISSDKDAGNTLNAQAAKDADIIGMGAIIFNDLFQGREKGIDFDLERMLDMQQASGPYLQYTCIRCRSLLAKMATTEDQSVSPSALEEAAGQLETVEQDIFKKIAEFPDVVKKAAKNRRPHYIAGYLYELCGIFNTFYNQVNVGKSEGNLKLIRLKLVEAVKITLENGLKMLCIDIPSKM